MRIGVCQIDDILIGYPYYNRRYQDKKDVLSSQIIIVACNHAQLRIDHQTVPENLQSLFYPFKSIIHKSIAYDQADDCWYQNRLT